MESNYTLSDLAAVTNNDGMGFGGGSWLAWILLFALFGGNGFGWGGRNGNPVTEADLCNANSFSDLKNAVGRLSDSQAAIARQTDNAICQIGYQNLQNTSTLASQIAECCCTTQRGIDSVKFDMANYASAIQMNDTANTQKILDAITGNKIADMQAQIQQLQLQSALCGVIRYPTATTYAVPSTCFGTSACNTCAY